MRLPSNPFSATNRSGNTSNTAPATAADGAASTSAPAPGTLPGVRSQPASLLRRAGLGRIGGPARPAAPLVPFGHDSGVTGEAAALVAANASATPERPTLHRGAGARDLQHTPHDLPVATAVRMLPVGAVLGDLSASPANHGLPVATEVQDLPAQYAQPVPHRQTGLSASREESMRAIMQDMQMALANPPPYLAERRPLRRETSVVRPSDFLNPADGESGSRMRLQ